MDRSFPSMGRNRNDYAKTVHTKEEIAEVRDEHEGKELACFLLADVNRPSVTSHGQRHDHHVWSVHASH
ncbi:hypothetical protein GsuE55_35580 [Geobacillus subterraneus]|uniref:Uncharacterized protein n=1 Tax=Geobacillus subterraneus TaxID=129338 RepID=A0A679FVK0_9BACL|nr:hypothetical protein B4113_3954 [Geobacillus sp. B4113_201601]BBW98725.1 hypothetical protein GsuE55_35580 [Geobacillus subterraneus]